MKMYSEKGNAKRAAKGLADKYKGQLLVEEPIRAPGGGNVQMWYPAVRVREGGHTLTDAQINTIGESAQLVAAAASLESLVPDPAPADPKGKLVGKVSLADVMAGNVLGVKGKKDKAGNVHLKSDGKVDLRSVVNMPKTKSTPDEVKARREARKAAPKAAAPAKGPTKTEQALALISRKGGATAPHLREALAWGTHTLRGWVSLQNSKDKRGIATLRKDGVTTYFIPEPEKK